MITMVLKNLPHNVLTFAEMKEQYTRHTILYTCDLGTETFCICTAYLHVNVEEATFTCNRNQCGPSLRVMGTVVGPFLSRQQTFFFGPSAFQMRMQKEALTLST